MGTPRLEMWLCEGDAGSSIGFPYAIRVREGAPGGIDIAKVGAYVPLDFRSWITNRIAAIQAIIGAPASCGVDANGLFYFSNNVSTYYYLQPQIALFLGFTPVANWSGTPVRVGSGTQTADRPGMGHRNVWSINIAAPRPIEETSFREYRHGRAVAYTGKYGRVSKVEIVMDSADADTMLAGPLMSAGKVRLYPDGFTAQPWNGYNPGGYIDVMPLDKPVCIRGGYQDREARITVECGLE